MHYVLSDIHNDNEKFKKVLDKISFNPNEDTLYVLGDLFDRADYNPDPIGVYFTILSLGDSCKVIRGNHDEMLAEYINNYLKTPEKKRSKLSPYPYNTFDLLRNRLTEVDMKNMAEWIRNMPLQIEVSVGGEKYLLAHAQTSVPDVVKEETYYLYGEGGLRFLLKGTPGYISVCGHNTTDMIRFWTGEFHLLDETFKVWINPAKNLYEINCGCGYGSKLACMRLEDKVVFE